MGLSVLRRRLRGITAPATEEILISFFLSVAVLKGQSPDSRRRSLMNALYWRRILRVSDVQHHGCGHDTHGFSDFLLCQAVIQ